MPAPFDLSKLPSIQEPWGPSATIPESLTFNDVPYAPFSKSDKLGKAADWQTAKDEDQLKQQQQQKSNQAQKKRDQYHAYGASAAKLFGAETEQEEFSVVDNSATPASKQQAQQTTTVLRGRRGQQQHGNTGGNTGGNKQSFTRSSNDNRGPQRANPHHHNNNNRYNSRYYNKDEGTKPREPSVKIGSAWKQVSEIEFNKLTKLNVEVKDVVDVETYGSVHSYNKKFESFRSEPLKAIEKTIVELTTSKDPIIQKLAAAKKATIFATDSILAQLMCSARSSLPWDIIVTKKNGVISFDTREDIQLLEVDENPYNSPSDSNREDINSASKLSVEATNINHRFIANTLDAPVHKFTYSNNPLTSSSSNILNKGYKYRKFTIPPNNLDSEAAATEVIVRCEIDSIQNGKFININALNQYDPQPSSDWKTKLSSGVRGVIFAEELKKNNNKISKWITKSLLTGSDLIKIGFVSRFSPKDNNKHVVAGALSYTPQVLASQIRLTIGNGWGVVKSLVDIIEHEANGDEDYKFVIMKDPNAPKLSIYKVPFDTFA